jgi:anti-anti-sigma factor
MALAEVPVVSADLRAHPFAAATVECLDSSTVVHLHGELDLSTVDELSQAMARAIAQENPLVVDMSDVQFMDATTIGVLMRCAAFVHARARSITVRRPSDSAARMLTICRLDDLDVEGPPLSLVTSDREGS